MVPVSASRIPDEVSTARLRLPVITPVEARAILGGHRETSWHPDYPRKDDVDAAGMVRDGDAWGPRHIVRAFDGQVCGSIGFFGPPQDADDEVPEVEVGYGLVPDARGHGAATEALQGLLGHVDAAGIRVRASVEPTNTPSVRVLAKCGFTGLRGSDEDGNLVMVRPLPA